MGIFFSRKHERPVDKASVWAADDDSPCSKPGCEHIAAANRSQLEESWWEHRCRPGDYPDGQNARCILIPPADACRRASVVLLLLGDGHVGGKQDLLADCAGQLIQDPVIRSQCYVVIPDPTYESGLVCWRRKPEWNGPVVWEVFTEVLRRLGADRVNFARLYATGISMGAAGVWDLAIRYGEFLAAVAPIAGRCAWPENSWPMSSPMPHPKVSQRLLHLPMRAYQTNTDRYADNPTEDMEWLGKGCTELACQRDLPGVESGKYCHVKQRVWQSSCGGADMELWSVQGPLSDWPSCHLSQRFNDHLLWFRVYPKEEWGLGAFFQRHSTPRDRQWHPGLSFDPRPFEPFVAPS
ncbi:unnamed protein product [Symbiodinium necroappetens]|uniref:Uncharacterized protein n=1 Tax=Symbiodinium necroappetens TaxID=1628268 RepID=A0A812QP44_9DINO|nr:unnamed protein product [Symbiodinium necroappetens]